MKVTLPTFNAATVWGGDYPLVVDSRDEALKHDAEPFPILLGNRIRYLMVRDGWQGIDIFGDPYPLEEVLLEPLTLEV